MKDSLTNIVGRIYQQIPKQCRPVVKSIFYWVLLRCKSIFFLRRICKGSRVEFLDFEIAYLEKFEFLCPGKGEVLLESYCSLVSPGTERAVLCGLPGARRSFPYVPGYSAAGRIIRVGKGVREVKVGDRVCGRVNHASHCSVSLLNLFPIPEGVSYLEACFIELGIIVLQGIRKARIKPGDCVAVVGQGLIGQLTNRILRLLGPCSIVAVADSRRRQRTAILPGGADEYIALSEYNGDLRDIQADIVIEAAGTPQAILSAMKCARAGGKVVLLGSSRGLGRDVDLWSLAQKRSLTIFGAHISTLPEKDVSFGRWTYHHEGRLFLSLLEAARLSVADLITWSAQPDECNAVYEKVAQGGGQHVGLVFRWQIE